MVRLKDAINRFLEHKREAKKAFTTVESYGYNLNNASTFLGNCDVSKITKRRLQDWIFDQCSKTNKSGRNIGEKGSAKSATARVKSLKVLFNWLRSFDEYDGDVAALFQNLEYPNEGSVWQLLEWETLAERRETLKREQISDDRREAFQKVYLSPEEASRLLEVVENKLAGGTASQRRLFFAVCFAVYTSARRSEIARFRRRDVDLERGVVRLHMLKGRGLSAIRRHEFPIHDEFRPLLEEHLSEHVGESLFCCDDAHLTKTGTGFDEKGVRAKSHSLTDALKDALRGTEFELCSGWHIYRHSFISAVGQNLTPAQAMVLVGHQTERVHLAYRHTSIEDRSNAVAGLSFKPKKGTEGV
ncbi:MAG: tyrosine-type recombinase/integrase [Planctomycetota bacterium]|nr:tyrosine-type recombinase/integrase [Planctomycetota bacterium]